MRNRKPDPNIELTQAIKLLQPLSWATARSFTKQNSLIIDVKYHDVTFADLATISEIFKTKKINIGSEAREGGYCDTCRHSYSVTVLTVMEPILE